MCQAHRSLPGTCTGSRPAPERYREAKQPPPEVPLETTCSRPAGTRLGEPLGAIRLHTDHHRLDLHSFRCGQRELLRSSRVPPCDT